MGLRIPNLIPRRRAHRVLLGVLLLLIAAWFVVPQVFVPTIRAKLQGMIGGNLDARLEIGRLMYAPPFGVRARDVRLVAGSSAGAETAGTELLKVRKLDLKLARLPFHKGPLVIQNITVHDPEVHLIRTADGRLVGMHALVKPDAPTVHAADSAAQPSTQPAPATQPTSIDIERPQQAEQEAARAKLSDMFELRHFGIKGGRVVYEDRGRPDLPPVVWKDLNVGMETTPKSKAVYGYTLEAIHGDLARLTASGSFDLDRLLIDLGALHLDAQTSTARAESPLPAQVQQVLRDYRVEGRVLLDARGHFDLRDAAATNFSATIELRDASGYSPQWDSTLDHLALKLAVDNQGLAPGAVRIHLDQLQAVSGDSVARLDKAQLSLDRASNTWSVADASGRIDLGSNTSALPKSSRPILSGLNPRGELQFTFAASGKLRATPGQYVLTPEDIALLIYPRAVSLHPKFFPAPLKDLGGGGSVRKDRGSRIVVFDNLTFSYGGDPVSLTSARLQLPPNLADLRRNWRVEEVAGTIDFRRPGARYPGAFGNVIESLRPVGPFNFGRDSWFAVAQVDAPAGAPSGPAPRRKGDWFFSVSTDAGSFTLTDDRVELNHLKGDATVSNMLIDVRRLEADVLGGKLTAALQVTPGEYLKYQGRVFLRGVDLEAVSKVYILPETKEAKLTGVGNLNLEFAGVRPDDGRSPFETLRAAGEFEILRGQFWTIPLLGEVARRAGGGKEMTVGEAAGVFDVADRQILLRRAAVSSPALGVQGTGAIGLDRRLDLNVVAAPLGDWRDKLKQTNIPLVSEVAGEVAGALQKVVNSATSHLLYEFRITGTTGHPSVATIPVPALTDTAAALFSGMLREGKEGTLLESVKGGPTRKSEAPIQPLGTQPRRGDRP